jgi:hypothetical protein
MHLDDFRQQNSESCSSQPSSRQEESSPSASRLASTTGESVKPSVASGPLENTSPGLSDSSATQSIASLISQSLAIQESLQLSMEKREEDARAKAHAMTWGNPLWVAARKRQADMGKEPQWLSDRGAGFDRKVEAPPPVVAIQIQHTFVTGEAKEKIVTIGPPPEGTK